MGQSDGRDDRLDVVAYTERSDRGVVRDRYSNHLVIPPDRSGIVCGRDVIDASSRDNRLLLYRLDRSMQRNAYRHRPLNAVPKPEPTRKPKPKRLPDDAIVPCPRCQAEIPTCAWCDGEGHVTAKRAREMG